MEAFKLVEKAMKTKAFSKEGLSAAAKLEPEEIAKAEACEFLGNMVDELERHIETMEAESETLQATMKKGKNQSSKADRLSELEHRTERHKWHQSKLELIKRALENGGIETEKVNELEESIRYYVTDSMSDDFMDDDEMYDDLNLDEEEEAYGLSNEDKISAQDLPAVPEEVPEHETRTAPVTNVKSKIHNTDSLTTAARRSSSNHSKSPLPALATLHTPLSNMPVPSNMKPAALPTRAPGETLKYASAAAAAASSNVGLAPLPPPPSATPSAPSNVPALPAASSAKVSKDTSATISGQNTTRNQTVPPQPQPQITSDVESSTIQKQSPALSHASAVPSSSLPNSKPPTPASDSSKPSTSRTVSNKPVEPKTNGAANDVQAIKKDDESVFHLPSELQDLVHSFEVTQSRASLLPQPTGYRMLDSSWQNRISAQDIDQPFRATKIKDKVPTPDYYPQTPLPIFDNPQLYSRVDPDSLFYCFYYKQGTYQQYLAAKSLKEQSWRFHKQYQTWFQRHEEPKQITDDFEQGTYRFFDYESTW
jgi:CCR4-NOT transcription complex subunit 3